MNSAYATAIAEENPNALATHQLLCLTPEDAAKIWPVLSTTIQETLPGSATSQNMANVLAAIMRRALEVWVLVREEGDEILLAATLTLSVVIDSFTADKSLLIYTFNSDEYISNELYDRMFKAVSKYARERGCTTLTAISNHPKVIRVAERFGAASDSRFLTLRLED